MSAYLSRYRPVGRRHLLRTAGVGLALPWLESMTPAFGSAVTVMPRRFVSVCTALGLYPESFWPTSSGRKYEPSEYLQLLAEHRDEFTVLGNLQHEDQVGRQPHDSELTWLTSARFPGMGGFRNTISVDQVAARHYEGQTRFSSVTLGTHTTQSQSYTDRGVMIPAQFSPAKLFARLFLQGQPQEVAAARRRLRQGRSILDELKSETRRLQQKTSSADNHLLDDYFESVRSAEKNLARRESWMDRPKPTVQRDPVSDIHDSADLVGRIDLLMELTSLILATDSSRVVTLMIHNTTEAPKIKGVNTNHHTLSHHGKDAKKLQQLRKVESSIVACFGGLLQHLKSHHEQNGSLLDQCLVMFGSNLGNANAHHTNNVPVIVAGGRLPHGTYHKPKETQPLSNLFVRLLNELGTPTETFGQSNASLSWSADGE
ncbi:MAG: DUF1552 domain-containing protein [Planctomycetaceae bacterium]|nr:DUF1552 domain-containing protein [Planctomycetaceae bacterium]